jgi:DNA gyrase/topoisomerase IV subunit B
MTFRSIEIMSEKLKKQETVTRTYTDENIQSVDGINQIILRPTLFIGSLYAEGVYRLFTEAYANVVDEFSEGRGNLMVVRIDSKESTIYVEDNCSGIPIGKFEDIITRPFTGGKYNKNAYRISVGLNGCGLKVIAAASDMLTVDTYREGKHAHGEFSKGLKIKIDITDDNKHHSGTAVFFRPDITLMKDISMNYQRYKDAIEICSYMNPGLKIDFTFDDKHHVFYHPGQGVAEYYNNSMIVSRNVKPSCPVIHITGENSYIDTSARVHISGLKEDTEDTPVINRYSVFVSWGSNVKQTITESYVNGLKTLYGGTHVKGVTQALQESVKKYIDKYALLPKNSPFSIDGSDVMESCVLLVDCKHSNPVYSTQIKNELTIEDIRIFARSDFGKKFTEWLELNPTPAKEIAKLVILTAKAKHAASEAKQAVKSTVVSNTILNGMKKLTMCRSNKPAECELFIVEGDSAGGSAKIARNADTQAIYFLTGKPVNAYKETDIDKIVAGSGPLGEIVKVLGCGYGKNFDYSKLRFHKINLLADADPDGSHIKSILLGFFYRCYPMLIEKGHIYLSNPPLFRFGFSKKREIYFTNMEEYWDAIENSILVDFKLCATDGKKLYPVNGLWFAKQFLIQLRGYAATLENAARQVNVDPNLLEYILANWNHVNNSACFGVNGYELDVRKHPEHDTKIIEGVYDNVFYRTEINEFFVLTCRKVLEQLARVKWSNLLLYHKPTKSRLGPGPYKISSGIERMINNSATITRYKGAGEMNPSQLERTVMDPSKRRFTRVTMDCEEAQKYTHWLDILIGNDINGRKNYYRKFI